jgi:hypothetical protein
VVVDLRVKIKSNIQKLVEKLQRNAQKMLYIT